MEFLFWLPRLLDASKTERLVTALAISGAVFSPKTTLELLEEGRAKPAGPEKTPEEAIARAEEIAAMPMKVVGIDELVGK